MPLYSKDGSYPYPYTDGTEGWVEVPDMPEPPPGKEVVWWCPPGWVIRDPEPAPVPGYQWKWNQTDEVWVSYPDPSEPPVPPPDPPQPNGTLFYSSGNVTGNLTADFSGNLTLTGG